MLQPARHHLLRFLGKETGELYFLSLSSAYPFPDVAALMDLLYISRSSVFRPTLQTVAPIQSSTFFSHGLFGLPLFLLPSTFPSSINFSSVCCIFMSKKPDITLIFLFSKCPLSCISFKVMMVVKIVPPSMTGLHFYGSHHRMVSFTNCAHIVRRCSFFNERLVAGCLKYCN